MKHFENGSKLIFMQDMNSCSIDSDIVTEIVSADFYIFLPLWYRNFLQFD